MSNSKDVVNKTISKAHTDNDPVHIVASCVKAMDHLKSETDPKLNMSLGFIQSELSKVLVKMTFKPNRKRSLQAVNENVHTKH